MTLKASTQSQIEICKKWGAAYLPCTDYMKIGISRDFDRLKFPINGHRHSPQGGTSGWYIWSGTDFSTDDDFFNALHAIHLREECPEVLNYLGLGPGWRFLLAPGCEDVWFDQKLLDA